MTVYHDVHSIDGSIPDEHVQTTGLFFIARNRWPASALGRSRSVCSTTRRALGEPHHSSWPTPVVSSVAMPVTITIVVVVTIIVTIVESAVVTIVVAPTATVSRGHFDVLAGDYALHAV